MKLELTKKHKYYNIKQAVIYTLLALMMIIGFAKSEPLAFGSAILVGICASYWIWKSSK